MTPSTLLNLFHFFRVLLTCLLVIGVHFLALPFDLFRDLLVDFKFAVSLALSLTPLCHEHFPTTHVVHSLVLVCEEVSFDQWTVTHIDAASTGFKWAFASDISKSHF